MKKIKDTPIAEKLPIPLIIGLGENKITYGYSQTQTLNTDLDINEIAEVDVEKIKEIIAELDVDRETNTYIGTAQAIAKAGVLKWKEGI